MTIPQAVAGAAEDYYGDGVKSFLSRDYKAAKRSFERARSAGMNNCALNYNYGSTLYKLGQYAEAQAAFSICADDTDWAALSRYNMGLAAFQQGRRNEAAEYFGQVWRYTDDSKLVVLAQTMLERIEPAARQYPHGTFSFSVGHDSNVILSDQAQAAPASGKSDNFSELLATTGARFGRDTRAPRWEAAFYDLRYSSLNEFGITQILLGLHVPRRIENWNSEIGGQGWYILRDGSAYQQIASLKAGTTRDWENLRSLHFELRYDRIESIDNRFQFLNGQRLQFGATMAQPAAAGRIYYGATYENNNRRDLYAAGEFFSYSPSRVALWFKGSWSAGPHWQLEPRMSFQVSRYADEDRRTSGIIQTREDSEWQLGLLSSYRLPAAWKLTGEYSYSGSRSNFDEFSYTRHQLMIGVSHPL